jgi:hypothetical protein
MFCAAVPVAGAVGAKLNADQKRKSAAGEQIKPEIPVSAITGGVIVLLITGSVVYHTTLFGKA